MPDSIEIRWICLLLNLNIRACSVVVLLDGLHLLLLQIWREIILLLVIKIINSSNFLIPIFGILLLRFVVILSQYQWLINIRYR